MQLAIAVGLVLPEQRWLARKSKIVLPSLFGMLFVIRRAELGSGCRYATCGSNLLSQSFKPSLLRNIYIEFALACLMFTRLGRPTRTNPTIEI